MKKKVYSNYKVKTKKKKRMIVNQSKIIYVQKKKGWVDNEERV